MILDSGCASPLYIAAASGRYNLACELVRSGSDVNTRCYHARESVLYCACAKPRDWMSDICEMKHVPANPSLQEDNLNLVRLLLTRGSDVNHQETEYGFTPLHALCFNDSGTSGPEVTREFAQALLSQGASLKIQSYADWPVFNAPGNRRPSPNIPRGATPLHVASAAGNDVIVDQLLRAGADPNARTRNGWTPLHCAMIYRKTQSVVRLLLIHGADLTLGCTTTSRTAAETTDVVPLSLLLSKYDKAVKDMSPCGDSILDIVRTLLESGADFSSETLDSSGRSPYHVAVETGNLPVLDMLVSSGRYLQCLDSPDSVGFHAVSKASDPATLVYLLRAGVPLPPHGYKFLDRREYRPRDSVPPDVTCSVALVSAGVPLTPALLMEFAKETCVMENPCARAGMEEAAPVSLANTLRRGILPVDRAGRRMNKTLWEHAPVPSLGSLVRDAIRKCVYNIHHTSILPHLHKTGLPPLVADSFLVMINPSEILVE